MGEVARLVDVAKAFLLRHNRSDSLKSRVIGLFHPRYREERELIWALQGVSFAIPAGHALGVIGRNGSGKTTLLRLLAGIFPPTRGQVLLRPSTRVISMIEVGVGFHPELTGRENVYLNASVHGLHRREIDAIYGSVVTFSELQRFMDTPLKNYSSGMQMRLGFAVAANLQPDLLLIDEVFAVGDQDFQQKCISRMQEFKARGTAIVLVSHSLDLITAHCDRACLLNAGRMVTLGAPAQVCAEYHRVLQGVQSAATAVGAG